MEKRNQNIGERNSDKDSGSYVLENIPTSDESTCSESLAIA